MPTKRKPKPKPKPKKKPVCDIHTFVTIDKCGCEGRWR